MKYTTLVGIVVFKDKLGKETRGSFVPMLPIEYRSIRIWSSNLKYWPAARTGRDVQHVA